MSKNRFKKPKFTTTLRTKFLPQCWQGQDPDPESGTVLRF
jgi:hypothetical protein